MLRLRGLGARLVVGVLLLFLMPTLAVGALLLWLYRSGVLADPVTLALTVAIGFVTMMGYLGTVAHAIGRSLVRTIQEIQLGAELITTVNPAHRLPIRGDDELAALAGDINRLADRLGDARDDLAREVAHATHALTMERGKLAAVLAALGDGVLVATPEGRLLLVNRVAHELLGGGRSSLLGRSLFDLVERGPVGAALERLEGGAGAGQRFGLTVPGGTLDTVMTPFFDEGPRVVGFILVLRPEGPGGQPGAVPAPAAPARPRSLVGAGLSSGVEPGETVPERPGFYDLSLLEHAAGAVPPATRDRRLAELAFAVLDTETTGLYPERGDRIVSLAAVRVREGEVRASDSFDALVYPGRLIPETSTRFHGITDAMVAEAPPIDEVLPAFLRFANGTVLVGHEIGFDLRFLGDAATRLGLPPLGQTHAALDTLLLSTLVHGALEDHGLEAVARRLGVPVRGRHSALGDALTTAHVLVRLLELLDRRGIRTLGQALDAGRRLRRPPGAPAS